MKAIKYPFTLNAFGVLKSTQDPGTIYLDKLLTLLSTHIGQRPMYPSYGTDFGAALFENEGNVQRAVQTCVSTAVKRWLPEVKLLDISAATFDGDGKATFSVSIQIPTGAVVESVIRTGVFKSDGTITAG